MLVLGQLGDSWDTTNVNGGLLAATSTTLSFVCCSEPRAASRSIEL